MVDPADPRVLRAASRLLKVRQARDNLVAFAELTMPHPADPDDPDRSLYEPQYFHHALGAALEEVEAGRIKKLIITFPPRHGKSELTSKRFPAWFLGRNPHKSLIFGTYNQDFAEDFGRGVRDIVNGDGFKQTFGGVGWKPGSASSARLETTANGLAVFVGRGGSVTGRGGHGIIIDDPLKNSEEADSDLIRDDLWTWFVRDIRTRRMDKHAFIIIIQTRWHEDDLVGRLTDPKNTHYDAQEAKEWKIINIPALAEEDDILGRPVGAALWPERFDEEFLLSFKRTDPRGFFALYQQRPTPPDGEFFKAEDLVEYLPHQLPPLAELRLYMSSDHAVSEKQHNDRTCILVGGVDTNGNLWILPNAFWKRAASDVAVEALLDLAAKFKPLRWWAEDDHIRKSIGPFLKQRMAKRNTYVGWTPIPGYADKQKKAQAIQGRTAWKSVLFPAYAPWWADARDELLKFPRGTHDDFVDALAGFGRGLGLMFGPAAEKPAETGPKPGTWAAIKQASDQQRRAQKVRLSQANR